MGAFKFDEVVQAINFFMHGFLTFIEIHLRKESKVYDVFVFVLYIHMVGVLLRSLVSFYLFCAIMLPRCYSFSYGLYSSVLFDYDVIDGCYRFLNAIYLINSKL
jgi:hypothetical protein